MSVEKKKYMAPKYKMVKFDSHIMTGFTTGCWGVIGVLYEDGHVTDDTCHVTTGNYSDVWPIEPYYND